METKKNDELKLFLNFINKNLNEMETSELLTVINDYGRFLFPGEKYTSNFNNIQKYIDYFIKDIEGEGQDKRKKLDELQRNLQKKVDRIIKAEGKAVKLVSVKGTLDLWCNFDQDGFEQKFEQDLGTGSNSPFDMKREKRLADLAYLNLLIDQALQPSRFGKCVECQSYFYSYTNHKKKYCSKRCSNTARQRSYREKGRQDG